MNEAYKLAQIRSGDLVVYRNGRGTLSRREVEGWKDTPGARLLLLEGGMHCRVEQVLERRRKGCEHSIIRFEETS